MYSNRFFHSLMSATRAAMAVSFGLHFMILHVSWMADLFSIVPLTWPEWQLVLLFSFPVILIDEVLKAVGRSMERSRRAEVAAERIFEATLTAPPTFPKPSTGRAK